MPKIPGFEGGISQRVPGANLSGAGTGATAKALANLGSQGAGFANQLLMERKKFEAENFKNDKLRETAVARQNFIQENRAKMDSKSGRMPDGRSWNEHVEEFETTTADQAVENAPTELAKQNFMSSSSSFSRKNLLDQDEYQHLTIIKTRDNLNTTDDETEAKAIRSKDPAAVRSSLKETEQRVLERYSSYIGSIYTDEQARLKTNLAMQSISNQALENLYENGDVSESLFQLAHTLHNQPETLAKFKGEIEKSIGKSLGDLKFLNDGSGVYFEVNDPKNPEKTMYDVGSGKYITATDQKINFEDAIQVGGSFELPPSTAEKYLTPQQKDGHIDRLISLIDRKKSEGRAELNRDHSNLVTALQETNPIIKKRTTDPLINKAYVDHVNKIFNNVEDMSKAAEMIGEVVLARGMGELMDSVPRQSLTSARASMAQLESKFQTYATELAGIIPEQFNKPAFLATIKSNFLARADSVARKLEEDRLKDPAQYVQEYFPEVARLKQNAKNSNDFGKYVDVFKQTATKLGVPDFMQSSGLSKGELKSSAASFMAQVNTPGQSGVNNAVGMLAQWKSLWGENYDGIVSEMKDHGLDKKYIFSAMLPLDSDQGMLDASRIIQNTKAGYYQAAPDDVKAMADDKIFTALQSVNRGVIQNMNFGDDVLTVDTLQTMVGDEVSRRIFEYQGDSDNVKPSDSTVQGFVNDAVKLVTNHWTNVTAGSTSVNVPTSALMKAKVPVEDVESAVEIMQSPAFLNDKVDLEKTFPNLARQATEQGLTDPVQRKNFFNTMLGGQSIIARYTNGKFYPSIRSGGNSVKLKNKSGQDIEVKLEQIPSLLKSAPKEPGFFEGLGL